MRYWKTGGLVWKKRVHLKLGHNPRMPTITSENRVGREDGQKHDSRFCQTIQNMHSRLTFLRVSSVVFHDKLLYMEAAYQSRRANSKQHKQEEEKEGERGRDGGMGQDIPLNSSFPRGKDEKG